MAGRDWSRRNRNFPNRQDTGTDWLSPQAYNALSREEKMALAVRRQLRRGQRNRKIPRRRRGGRWPYQLLVALGAVALVFGYGWFTDLTASRPVATPTGAEDMTGNFSLCPTGGGTNCVVDGDTIWLEGQNIRIADIDAPETSEPSCAAEKALGERATRRLHALVNGGTVSVRAIERDEDVYGRKLRIVLVDGTSVGDTLVAEGLARWYRGGRRSWC